MKKILTIICFFGLAFIACQKDFLEKKPIVGVTEENFYRTEEDAIAGVNAAYATLQFQMSPAGHFRWFWGDIMSDDAIKGGSGDNDANDLLQLETFKGPSNTDLLESEWGADYEGIYRLCYIRGPEGILIGLAQELGQRASDRTNQTDSVDAHG